MTDPTSPPPSSLSPRPLPGLFAVEAPVIHAGLTVEAAGLLTITTPPGMWAYAVSFAPKEPARRVEGRILVRVTGWVEAGRVGIGLVDGQGRIEREVFRAPHDGLTHFDLWTDALPECQALVVRNAADDASRITIEAIRAYRGSDASAAATIGWIEHRRSVVAVDGAPGRAAAGARERHVTDPGAGAGRAGDGGESPMVSLVLVVKNGMPYLAEAVESLRRLRYPSFEVIVQDGGSTDGTLEYLRSVTDVPMSIVSERDGGIGDARDRAHARCRADIVGSIDADNVLSPDALSTAVAVLRAHPEAAAVYGAVDLIDAAGRPLSRFVPGDFDLLRVISCEVVPPWSTAFFSRRVCGPHLVFDASIAGCVDFDSWLRVGHLPILRIDRVLGSTRVGPQSVTCRVENYDRFCAERIRVLERYLGSIEPPALAAGLLRQGVGGVYCWAAESVLRLGASRADVARYVHLALGTDPTSERARRLGERLAAPRPSRLRSLLGKRP